MSPYPPGLRFLNGSDLLEGFVVPHLLLLFRLVLFLVTETSFDAFTEESFIFSKDLGLRGQSLWLRRKCVVDPHAHFLGGFISVSGTEALASFAT